MKHFLLNTIAASLLVLLFTYTAIDKLWQREVFEKVLLQVPLVAGMARPLSFGLPVLELLIAALIFFPSLRATGFYAAFFLLIFFTFYLAYMIAFLPHLPCSCGGVVSGMGWKAHIVFNLAFAALAWAGVRSEGRGILKYSWIRGSRKPVEKSRQSFHS